MKTYKEMANSILERRDTRIKNRKALIKFTGVFASGVVCLTLAVVLGLNFFGPKKPISVAQGGEDSCIMPGGNVGAVTSEFKTPGDEMIDDDAPVSVQSKFEGQTGEQTSQPSNNYDTYLPSLYINELGNLPIAAGSRLYFTPDEYDFKELTESEIKDYFKREILPTGAVRKPLKKSGEISATLITEKKSGKIAHDVAYVQYANKFYEDGSPMSAVDGGANVTIWASRLGKPNIDYSWQDGKYTELKGVKVYAGKVKNGYNYSESKQPTAFYTSYFAEFKVDGVYYEVTADNVSVEEFIRAVWGIIAD